MPSLGPIKEALKAASEVDDAVRAGKAAKYVLPVETKLNLQKKWGLAVTYSGKNELLQSAGELYSRDAAYELTHLQPNESIVYMDPKELRSIVGGAPKEKVLEPGTLPAIRLNGKLGPDGGLIVDSIYGTDGLDTFERYADKRRVPVIVPSTDTQSAQYLSYKGKNLYGLRSNPETNILSDYRNQHGRSLELIRKYLSPEEYGTATFSPSAMSTDVWTSLEMGLANVPRKKLADVTRRQDIRAGQMQRMADDLAVYKDMAAEIGPEKFAKMFKGKYGVTPRALYGQLADDVLGEFADYPVIGRHVERDAHVTPPAAQGVAARVGPREGGEHIGDSVTASAILNSERTKPPKAAYNDAKDVVEKAKLGYSVDPAELAVANGRVSRYEANLDGSQRSLEKTLNVVIPAATEDDYHELMTWMADFAEEWRTSGYVMDTKNWAESSLARKKLMGELADATGASTSDISDLVNEMAEFYSWRMDTNSTLHGYLMAYDNPLLMHDLSDNSTGRIAEFLQGMPEFSVHGDVLEKIRTRRWAQGYNEDLAARSDALFKTLNERGYDVIFYPNVAEGGAGGTVSPSWVSGRNPGKQQPNIAKLAPKTAKKYGFTAASAVFAPLFAALMAKQKPAEAKTGVAAPPKGYYRGEDNKTYYSDGLTLEAVK